MPRASEIKKNSAVEYDGRVYFVKDIERASSWVAPDLKPFRSKETL